jgi:hypothetical protein
MSGTVTRTGPFRLARKAAALWRDRTGAVLIEFAYTLPLFMLLSVTGLELVNLAVANMKISQIALTTADNLSRAKESVPLGLPRLREVDVNDALLGASIQAGEGARFFENGRIIVSSLQRNSAGRQTIAWQRCKGRLVVQSLYGAQGATQPASGSSGFQGMGRGTALVQAEPSSAVIFAEIEYDYIPIFGEFVFGPIRLRREAAYYVRDDRDLTGGPQSNGLYNPSPAATASNCNVYNDSF